MENFWAVGNKVSLKPLGGVKEVIAVSSTSRNGLRKKPTLAFNPSTKDDFGCVLFKL